MERFELQESDLDYDQLMQKITQYMQMHAAWKDTSSSRVATVLSNLMAGLFAFNSAGLPIAQREAFPTTARRQTSIYSAAEFLGVRISRKTPASVPVVLNRTGDTTLALSIPAYTQFSVGNRAFFNRAPIVFQPNQVQLTMLDQTMLEQGTVTWQRNLQLDGLQGFRKLRLGRPGFVVSDSDTQVFVDSVPFTRTTEGLFRFGPQDRVFMDTTVRTGDCAIILGNGQNGVYVTETQKVEIRYVETDGSASNYGEAPLQVTCSTVPQVQGTTVGTINGGSDEKDAEYYRFIAPYIHRTQNRAVTPSEHQAIALSYPGIADCLFQFQRKVNPNDIRWMNVTRLIILPTYADAMPVEQKERFAAWFSERSWANLELDLTVDPEVLAIDVVMNVFCHSFATLQDVRTQIVQGVQKVFEKRAGTLGRQLETTDLTKIASNRSDVDYVTLLEPTSSLTPTAVQFIKLNRLVVNVQVTDRRS